MRHTVTNLAPPGLNHMLLRNLSHAQCAHRVHQAREMGDLQALDTMIAVAILLLPVEDHRRNRGQEHVCKFRERPQSAR